MPRVFQADQLRRLSLVTAFLAGVLHAPLALAQPAAPSITQVSVNNGASARGDRVTVSIQYVHPAAPGVPIPWYRVRTWPQGRSAPAWGPFIENVERASAFSLWLTRVAMTTPIPGVHVVEVQIKDGLGRESASRSALVTREVVPVVGASSTKQFTVTGAEVRTLMRLAQQQGFQLVATPLNGNSECHDGNPGDTYQLSALPKVRGPGFLAPPPQAHCRFRFFQFRQLQAFWRLVSVTFAKEGKWGLDWVIEQPIKPSGSDPSFSIVVRNPPDGPLQSYLTTFLNVTSVVLEGPSHLEWRYAFQPIPVK